jgi:deoxycytidylate deaminase
MAKKIIGITGSLGSGCTRTAKYLQDKEGYSYISISEDILKPLAKKHSHPFSTREEKQNFGNLVREKLTDKYREAGMELINKSGNEIVIECFRNPIEIDFLRNEYPHFYLIALFAPKTRRRSRKNEPDFDSLDERDEGEENEYGQQTRKCVNCADIVIDNSNEWTNVEEGEEFFKNFNSYIKLFDEPYRPPTEQEMFMHLAYSVSLKSNCIQRQVGAVIVDENYKVLSTGYNDVPRNTETCINLYSECYRKRKKRKNLQNLIKYSVKYCPSCGADFILHEKASDEKNYSICNNCDIDLSDVISPSKELDYCRSLHAEENAILSNPYTAELFYKQNKTLTLFTTTFPCMLCAKKIANAGIRKVVFVEPFPVQESYKVLTENNVLIKAFEGVKSLSFNWIFRDRGNYIEKLALKRKEDYNKLKGE